MHATFDARWRKKALAADGRAIALLAEAALDPLFRFCFYRLGRDRGLCEDVVQETLLRAIREVRQYQPARSGGNIFPWLAGLARNEIRRALSSRRDAASLEALWGRVDRELLALYSRLESEPFPDELVARAETREMVNAAMSQLPPHYGAALEAKYVLGHSVRQIAAAFGLSEKAIESTLTRAREAFRVALLALTRNLGTDSTGE